MTNPSEAAKRKACELANAITPGYWKGDVTRSTTSLHALALHLDEVDRVAREIEACTNDALLLECARSLMLPDPVDPLEEVIREAGKLALTPTADWFRAELDKRGLTIAPKENHDAK